MSTFKNPFRDLVHLYSNPNRDTLLFINFVLNAGEGAPAVTSGPLWLYISTPWLKPLAAQLIYNLIFLNIFLLA